MWGLAAVHAYKAYPQTSSLGDSISTWRNSTIWLITEGEASEGTRPLKNGRFKSQCNRSVLCKSPITTADMYIH